MTYWANLFFSFLVYFRPKATMTEKKQNQAFVGGVWQQYRSAMIDLVAGVRGWCKWKLFFVLSVG